MEGLRITGGNPLYGTVEIGGAKNAVLPIMAATVAGGGSYLLHRCPQITDVTHAAEIIESLGGTVVRLGTSLWIDTSGVCRWMIPAGLMERMRASVLFLGALLARFGRAVLTMPGGCPLGRRPIDLHLEALAQMGATVCLVENEIHCEAGRLHGCTIDLQFPSVGATENILMAATACRGIVTVRHAAKEPEVGDLIRFLRTMGAQIEGEGSDTLTVYGSAPLSDACYTILPDRIETATYLCAAAACGGDVTLLHTDGTLLLPVLQVLERAGCAIDLVGTSVRLRAERLHGCGTVETAPYPGFPTDAQAVVMAAMLRARGESLFFERIFERRLTHGEQMRKFGADIGITAASALVRGVPVLTAAEAAGGDLRATAALVITALQAEGKSFVSGLNHLNRGYDNLAGKLSCLGAEIIPVACENTTGNYPSDGV